MPVERPPFATLVCLHRGPLEERFVDAAVGKTDAATDPKAAGREGVAVAAMARFRPVRVISSDRKRCVATAAAIASAAGAPHGARRNLRDRDFGAFEGRAWPEIVAADPGAAVAFLNAFASATPPGGETLPAVQERVLKTVLLEARRHHRRVIVWVADPSPIRCVIAYALGLQLADVQRMKLDPFGLTVVRLQADASTIAMLNAPADGSDPASIVW